MEKKKFCSAVIVAAGKGSRFKGTKPKQFEELDGKPLLYYSVKAMCDSPIIDEVILVTSEEWIDYCTEEIVKKYDFEKVQAIIQGGEERYDSVFAGMMAVDISSDYVFIQDGARPMLTEDILRRGFETVEKYNTAVAAVPVTDTIKITDDNGVVISTTDRKNTWRIQTPQIFGYKLLLNAYFSMQEEDKEGLTDDAMLIEKKTNEKVHLFLGSEDNIKVTRSEDLKRLKEKIRNR